MTDRTKNLNKNFDFNTIDPHNFYLKANKILTNYNAKGHSLNKPTKTRIKDISNRKTKLPKNSISDVFYSYFSTEGVILPLQKVFSLVPELNNYSSPVESERKVFIHKGDVILKFFGFIKARPEIVKKYHDYLKEKGKVNKKLNYYNDGDSLAYQNLILGIIANNSENYAISNRVKREELINNLSLEIPVPKDLIKVAKAYFLTLANARLNNKTREDIDFNDFCTEKEYIDKYLRNDLVSKITYSELLIYTKFLIARYLLLKDHIIESCHYLLDLVHKAGNTLNQQRDNINREKLEDLMTTTSYGLSLLTRGSLTYKNIHSQMNTLLHLEHVEFFEDCTVNQLVGVLNSKVTQPNVDSKIYRMSPFNNFSRSFYNYAKKNELYEEYFDDSTGIDIAIRRSSTHVLQNLRRIISSTLLKDAIKNQEKITLYLDSTLIESTAKLIDNCGFTYSKSNGYANCFKITLLQTENKIPIIFESGDGIVPDVKTLPDLLKNLDRLQLNNQNLLLCGDKGYFSEENIATLEALDFKYCLMAKDVKLIVSSAEKYRIGEWVENFNKEYKLNTIRNSISYSEYINLNKAYIALLEKHVQESKPSFTLESIGNRKINILHTLSSKDLKESFEKICNKTYDFYHEYKDQVSTEKQLKATKDSANKYFYINNEGKLSYNYDVIEKDLPVKATFSIVTNDLTLSNVDMINTYRGRMFIESSFSRLKTYQDMSSFCKHLNETAEMKNFINWQTLIVYNTLEHLLNTPITGISTKDKERERSREYLFKETKGNVDKLLVLAIKSFQVTFVGCNLRPIYKDLNKPAKAILNLLNLSIPELYQDVGFIESSSRIISKIKNKKNTQTDDMELSQILIDEEDNSFIKSLAIDY